MVNENQKLIEEENKMLLEERHEAKKKDRQASDERYKQVKNQQKIVNESSQENQKLLELVAHNEELLSINRQT